MRYGHKSLDAVDIEHDITEYSRMCSPLAGSLESDHKQKVNKSRVKLIDDS